MSQSEDYLDSLLNQVTKPENPAVQMNNNGEASSEQKEPEESVLKGLGNFFKSFGEKPPVREPLSESDFISSFEEELQSGDADAFIEAFEKEIDEEERIFEETGEVSESEALVAALIDDREPEDVAAKISAAIRDEEPESFPELPPMEDGVLDIDQMMSDSEELIAETEEDAITESEEESAEDEEDDLGLPDISELEGASEAQMDALTNGITSDDDLSDLSEDLGIDSSEEEPNLAGEEPDLDAIIDGESEGDLMDIQSLLEGDIDLAEGLEDEPKEDGKKKKGKKEKKPKEKKELPPILKKIALIVFGAPDEDDLAEQVDPAEKARIKEEKAAAKAAKKEAAEAAKKEKEEAKKAAEKDKESKPKKEKPPKPKKEKKPKEPDNSPKIPLSVIFIFLLLSASIIGVVVMGMNYMGLERHMNQAIELYNEGDYVIAYEKLIGLELTTEEEQLTRNRARILADLQQCKDEYDVFVAQGLHEFALDSLIKGVGRYEKYQDEAAEYGIGDVYNSYMDYINSKLAETYNITHEDALAIYKQKNRHYYTIELKKVLIRNGLDD